MNYIFDIIYDESMANRFISCYYPLYENRIIDKNIKKNKLIKELLKIIINEEIVIDKNSKNEYNIGDIIKISYSSDSQKYIDDYEDKGFIGKILFIDDKTDNMFLHKIVENNNDCIIIKSLEIEGCHFFGMARGYTYIIEKLK